MNGENLPSTSAYGFQICTDTTVWDDLVEASPQGNVFSKTAFLQSLGVPYTCYVVTDLHGETLAGAAILEEGGRMARAPFSFTPHQGILFAYRVAQLVSQKRLTTEFRITTYLIESLLSRYPNFSMSLSPYFKDLRPFLWHNYGQDSAPTFEVKHRYTGYLNLQSFDLTAYLASIRAVRRQEYKKTQAIVQNSKDLQLFLNLYQQTFERQDLRIDHNILDLVERICEQAMLHGYGYLSKATVANKTASMAFFISDSNCAYYLFGANDPEMRDANASAKLLIDNIHTFSTKNLKRFDFVGVNSPQRGDFKLSFNASLMPYHEVHLQPYV